MAIQTKWKEDWQKQRSCPETSISEVDSKTWSLPAPSVWSLKLAMCHSQRKHSSMFLVAVISIHILLVTGTRNVDCFNSWIYLILHEVLLPQPNCFRVIIIRSDPHYSFLDSGNCFLISVHTFVSPDPNPSFTQLSEFLFQALACGHIILFNVNESTVSIKTKSNFLNVTFWSLTTRFPSQITLTMSHLSPTSHPNHSWLLVTHSKDTIYLFNIKPETPAHLVRKLYDPKPRVTLSMRFIIP